MIDRLAHHLEILTLEGDSFRVRCRPIARDALAEGGRSPLRGFAARHVREWVV